MNDYLFAFMVTLAWLTGYIAGFNIAKSAVYKELLNDVKKEVQE